MQRRSWILGLTLVSSLCLLQAKAYAKHKHGDGVSQCQQGIANRIRADHPPSRGTSFDSDVQRSKWGNNAVTISGRGHLRTEKGKKRSFSYSCIYNHSNGKLSKVKYRIR